MLPGISLRYRPAGSPWPSSWCTAWDAAGWRQLCLDLGCRRHLSGGNTDESEQFSRQDTRETMCSMPTHDRPSAQELAILSPLWPGRGQSLPGREYSGATTRPRMRRQYEGWLQTAHLCRGFASVSEVIRAPVPFPWAGSRDAPVAALGHAEALTRNLSGFRNPGVWRTLDL